FKSARPKFLFYATQNLSGRLAVRSSSEDEHQAQHFTPILTDRSVSTVRKIDREIGRFARKVGCRRGHQCQDSQDESSKAHVQLEYKTYDVEYVVRLARRTAFRDSTTNSGPACASLTSWLRFAPANIGFRADAPCAYRVHARPIQCRRALQPAARIPAS